MFLISLEHDIVVFCVCFGRVAPRTFVWVWVWVGVGVGVGVGVDINTNVNINRNPPTHRVRVC